MSTVIFKRPESGEVVVPDISYIAFANSGSSATPVEFYLPWSKDQHRKFTGKYTEGKVEYDKDIFFGACLGSRLIFIDKDGNEIESIVKTM